MSYNNSTTTCSMPPPISPIPSYNNEQVDHRYNTAAVSGNSYYVNNPTSSPHWVSPIPSLGNPFSFDSHSSFVSGYASPVSPNTYEAPKYPNEQTRQAPNTTGSNATNVHLQRDSDANFQALMLPQDSGVTEVDTRRNEELEYDVMSDPGQYHASSSARKREHHNKGNETAASSSKDDSKDDKCSKTGFDMVRERGANLKALALLEQTVGYDISDVAKATSVYLHKPTLTIAEESFNVRKQLKANYKAKKMAERGVEEQRMLQEEALFESKSVATDGKGVLTDEEINSKYVRAKMIAEYKAVKKLEKYVTVAKGVSPESSRAPTSTNDTSHCLQQQQPAETTATKFNYDDTTDSTDTSNSVAIVPDDELSSKQIRAKIIAEYKAKKKLDKTVGYKIAAKETLAESSRTPKNTNDNNTYYDPETVAGMKCEMDIERENFARKKALQLLNDRPGLMA